MYADIVTDEIVLMITNPSPGIRREELIHNGIVVAAAQGPETPQATKLPDWPCEWIEQNGRVIRFVPLPVRPEDV